MTLGLDEATWRATPRSHGVLFRMRQYPNRQNLSSVVLAHSVYCMLDVVKHNVQCRVALRQQKRAICL
jgi:hypothetical protein